MVEDGCHGTTLGENFFFIEVDVYIRITNLDSNKDLFRNNIFYQELFLYLKFKFQMFN